MSNKNRTLALLIIISNITIIAILTIGYFFGFFNTKKDVGNTSSENILRPHTEAVEQKRDVSIKGQANLDAINNFVVKTAYYSVKKCLEGGGFVHEPKTGDPICSNMSDSHLLGEWFGIEKYNAEWGGCKFVINRTDSDFKFCFSRLNTGLVYYCQRDYCTYWETGETAEKASIKKDKTCAKLLSRMAFTLEELNEEVENFIDYDFSRTHVCAYYLAADDVINELSALESQGTNISHIYNNSSYQGFFKSKLSKYVNSNDSEKIVSTMESIAPNGEWAP